MIYFQGDVAQILICCFHITQGLTTWPDLSQKLASTGGACMFV